MVLHRATLVELVFKLVLALLLFASVKMDGMLLLVVTIAMRLVSVRNAVEDVLVLWLKQASLAADMVFVLLVSVVMEHVLVIDTTERPIAPRNAPTSVQDTDLVVMVHLELRCAPAKEILLPQIACSVDRMSLVRIVLFPVPQTLRE